MKQKKGVAVGYSPGKRAPEILAVAKGFLVDKLLQIARENGITIYEDPDLTEILSYLKPGSEIPEHLFQAMAEVLAYCYAVNSKFKSKMSSTQ
jgi:flagellar biosynthesis protein